MKTLLISFCLALLTVPAWSQISYTHTYHPQAGNPGGLNQEVDFSTTGWTILQMGGLSSNQWSAPISLPFSFSLYGQSFTQVRVSANGLLTFGTGNGNLTVNNTALPTPFLPTYTIASFWEQFTLNPPTSTNDFVQIKVFGNLPNRQCWIRWYSYEWGPASFAYFAVVLEEQGGVFHVVDQYSSLNASQISATVGVQQHASKAVQVGSNVSVPTTGSDHTDNSYYTFTPYLIPPEDIQSVDWVGVATQACGLDPIPLSLRLTNQGQQTADTLLIGYQLEGSAPVTETRYISLSPNDSLTVTFSQWLTLPSVGTHSLTLWASGIGDSDPSNDTLTRSLTRTVRIDQFPYMADFETGGEGWESYGIHNSWEVGLPGGTALQGASSGAQAWATNLSGTHNPFERSYVESPCMDFSSLLSDVWISLDLWWDTEPSWDGMSLQATVNDGQTWTTLGYVGPGWYNSAFIGSMPGDEGQGWAGQSNGWQPFSLPLPNSLLGQSQVKLRLAFAANGSDQREGVAFDRLIIGTPPVVDLGPDRFFCTGEVLSLTAAVGTLIQWHDGTTADSLLLLHTGNGPILDSLVTVTLTHPNGLSRTDSLRISIAPPISAQPHVVVPVSCAGGNDGQVVLDITGGTLPFSAVWSHGSSGLNPANFSAGGYTATLTDAHGCEGSVDTIWVSEPAPLSVQLTTQALPCHGDSSGQIQGLASGGNGGYEWAWNTGDSAATLSGLPSGSYTLTLTDSLGCLLTESSTLTQPDALQATAHVLHASCVNDRDGEILLTVVGGTAPYAVNWSTGSTQDSLTLLAPGSYYALVSDANGCGTDTLFAAVNYTDSAPVAGFGWTLDENELSLQDSSQDASSYVWDFGDGNSSTLAAPVHVFADSGSFLITQVVANGCGADTLERWITVSEIGPIDTTHTDTTNTDTAHTDTTTTGLWGQVPAQGYVLYPNPNAGTFSLGFPHTPSAPLTWRVYTTAGRVVLKGRIEPQTESLRISLPASLAAGQYYIQVIGEVQTYGIPFFVRY